MEERRKENYGLSERLTKVEVKLDQQKEDVTKIVISQEDQNRKLNHIIEQLAEQRGAARMAKAIWVGIAGLAGTVCGYLGRHL